MAVARSYYLVNLLQVVTVRKQKPKSRPAAAAPQQKQQSRFQNFQQVGNIIINIFQVTMSLTKVLQVEQQRSSPAYQQQQPRREQAYYQPAPQQPVQPAYQQVAGSS